MFTADHILFDITPNITHWSESEDSLGDYLDSLVKIRGYEMETAFPAHRKNDMDVYVRISQIIEHHLVRLCETVDALAGHPDTHATDIAAYLKWSMRGLPEMVHARQNMGRIPPEPEMVRCWGDHGSFGLSYCKGYG